MTLSDSQRKHLRRLGHELKPVVLTGSAGVTAAVLAEIEGALAHHELIKVRVRAGDREAREAMIARICAETGAELVQRVGHVALVYRPDPESPGIVLPA